MNITLVHNAGAGFYQISKDKLIEKLSGEGTKVTYISQDDNLSEALFAHPTDLIVVAGGDGTVRRIAHLLLDKHIPVAILPLGTANNIAKTLGHSVAINNSNERWMNLETRPFDAGLVKIAGEKEYFVESVGCGAVAEMIYQFKKEKKNKNPDFSHPEGELKYIQSFMKKMLQSYQACHYDITIDNQTYSGEYLLVEVMNIKSVGPHLWLAPEADPGDGWLDVVLVHAHEKEALYDYLSRLKQDQEHPAYLTVRRGKHIHITTTYNKLHIDDDISTGKHLRASEDTIQLDIQVQKNCLSMFKHSFAFGR